MWGTGEQCNNSFLLNVTLLVRGISFFLEEDLLSVLQSYSGRFMKLLETKVNFVSAHQWQYFSWSEDKNIAGGPGLVEPKTISRDMKEFEKSFGREMFAGLVPNRTINTSL